VRLSAESRYARLEMKISRESPTSVDRISCGRETLKEKLKRYLGTGEWAE
jgi:hypothetical protein